MSEFEEQKAGTAGWPDFFMGVYSAIVAQLIESLAINIVASQVVLDVVVQSGSINAYITNTQLNVNVVGGTVDVNVKNAELDVNIVDSQIIMEVAQSDWKFNLIRYKVESYTGEYDKKLQPCYIIITHGAKGIIMRIDLLFYNSDSVDHTITVEFRDSFEGRVIWSDTGTAPAGSIYGITLNPQIAWFSDSLFIKITTDDPDHVYIRVRKDSVPQALWWNPSYYKWEVGDCPYFLLDIATFNTPSVAVTGLTTSPIYGFDYTNKKWVPIAVTPDGKPLAKVG
ncbi:hypothetical protein J7K74_03745 [Candidatus Woesearchaeota archaeon]|nr:hypothetical protein [Candidatus Woesearchaeota archaeon]